MYICMYIRQLRNLILIFIIIIYAYVSMYEYACMCMRVSVYNVNKYNVSLRVTVIRCVGMWYTMCNYTLYNTLYICMYIYIYIYLRYQNAPLLISQNSSKTSLNSRAFTNSGPTLWNSLPATICSIRSHKIFINLTSSFLLTSNH